MKILLTNHQLINYAGTEVFIYTLADWLVQKGHQVVVYSAYVGEIREIFDAITVPVFDDVLALPDDFDIAHVHHNIIAYEIRNRFPRLPIVYMAHGIRDPLEHLPVANLEIKYWLAGSDGIYAHMLESGIPANGLEVFHNPVDEQRFFPGDRISSVPKSALVISNKIDEVAENKIRQACRRLGITCQFVGSRFVYVPNKQLPDLIRRNDLVFSLGRGVIETMFCGRVPIVFDAEGGDGMVTPENFNEIIKRNFSGKRYNRHFDVDELVKEIEKYKADYGIQLYQLAREEFSAEKQVDKLISIYEHCVGQQVPRLTNEELHLINSVCEMIGQTRFFSACDCAKHVRQELVYDLGGAKAFRLFRSLGKLRFQVFPENGWLVHAVKNLREKNRNGLLK